MDDLEKAKICTARLFRNMGLVLFLAGVAIMAFGLLVTAKNEVEHVADTRLMVVAFGLALSTSGIYTWLRSRHMAGQ